MKNNKAEKHRILQGSKQAGKLYLLLFGKIGKFHPCDPCADSAEGKMFRKGGDIINGLAANAGHTKIGTRMLHNIDQMIIRGSTNIRKIDKLEPMAADIFHGQRIIRPVAADKQVAFRNRMTFGFSSLYAGLSHNNHSPTEVNIKMSRVAASEWQQLKEC